VILTVLAALALADTAAAVAPRPSSCVIAADKQAPVRTTPGRVVYCGIDLGSRTVKLSVVSMEKDRPVTVRDERLCKRTLGMGALVFDSRTATARPLPDETIGHLVDTLAEYKEICARDGGTLVAAGATQWARDATNVAEVSARVGAATGIRLDVLTPDQEAEYGYAAASVATAGRIVLDAGSNSFELAWQEKDSPSVRTILVPYGYVRAAANEFAAGSEYARARAAYQEHARAMIEQQLARLEPMTSLAGLRSLVRRGRIGPDLIALGEDGAIVPLVARGRLREGPGRWIADGPRFDEALGAPRATDPRYGVMTGPPLSGDDLRSYLHRVTAADLAALRTEPVRGLYGQKALAVPALADLLMRDLGLRHLVTVPQEATTGHILMRLRTR
jgi:exopolyphosphatase/guanosine-5'-triphosphate,3'-diphosphate pyrophosphatase